jgi:hypothetical protein
LSAPPDYFGDTDAVHDTLDWRGYFPLEVGNVWQYDVEVWQGSFGTIGEWIEQWEIVGDPGIVRCVRPPDSQD